METSWYESMLGFASAGSPNNSYIACLAVATGYEYSRINLYRSFSHAKTTAAIKLQGHREALEDLGSLGAFRGEYRRAMVVFNF